MKIESVNDKMVYGVYELSDEDIRVVEGEYDGFN